MDEFIVWVKNNKEWLFSGVGLVIISVIGRIMYKNRQTELSQKIRSGKNSQNIQAGRDVKINVESKRNNVEEKK